MLALGAALLMATMYVYFRDIAHLWEVLQQVLFYSIPVIYPLSMVMDNDSLGKWGLIIAKIQLPQSDCADDSRYSAQSDCPRNAAYRVDACRKSFDCGHSCYSRVPAACAGRACVPEA